MAQVKLREKGQVTIPAELLHEWTATHQVAINDSLEVQLANGVLMFTPSKRPTAKRDIMSFAGIGKGLWGSTPAEIDLTLQELRRSWTR